MNGIPKSLYNQVANFTYLETPVNISIGKKSPSEYFTAALEQCKSGKIVVGTITDTEELVQNLVTNCIPPEIGSMTVDDYESRFLPARRKMMAAKIRKYYEAL